MTTSLTTFERQVRERLLDVIHAQWHDVGFPFSTTLVGSDEIIDPEALLWCSLEFLATEPRLAEAVLAWLDSSAFPIIRHRVNQHARKGEPRSNLWHALNRTKRLRPETPTEPCHGLVSADEVTAFCERLAEDRVWVRESGKSLGWPLPRPATALLWARNLLGSDIRHFLLVYLLANPGGGRLKTVQRWSGYTYRSISETATRWEAARVLAIDHGFCRLSNPEPWRLLLPQGPEPAVIVDWFEAFDACVRLLRALAKADRKGLALDGSVIRSHCRQAGETLSSVILGGSGRSTTIEYLRGLFPPVTHLSSTDREVLLEVSNSDAEPNETLKNAAHRRGKGR